MRDVKLALAVLLAAVTAAGCGIQEHNAPATPTVNPPPSNTGGSSNPPPQNPPPPQGRGGAGGGSSSGSGGGGGSPGSPGGQGGEAGGAPDTRRDGGSSMPLPPPTAEGLDLDGVRVPRERAVVLLHFGHSNMLGQSRRPSALRPYFFTPQPRLWIYRGGGTFVPAVEPTATPGASSRTLAGPGMALLRALAAVAPPDYHFISIGLGVGSATTQDWSKNGIHYTGYVARALELRGRVTFAAAVVMLGITDRHMPLALQPGFADRMTRIAADLRADLGEPNLPVLHTDYEMESSGTLAPDTEFALRIRPLILSLPMRIPTCAIVPTDMLGMEDDHHFDMQGQKDWSDRAIKILVDRRWLPWSDR